MTPAQFDNLELLVDSIGLPAVLDSLEVIAHEKQNGDCYNGETVDNKVHGVNRSHVMRSSAEHSARDEHPSSVELEYDSDKEIHKECGSEKHREQPDGEQVKESGEQQCSPVHSQR